MNRCIACAALLLLAGCSTVSTTSIAERRAGQHMARADSLEQALMLREATLQYSIVAERFAETAHYPNAVRKLAFLYMNPLNDARNDSAALTWFRVYADFPLQAAEKGRTKTYIAMLERLVALEGDIAREQGTADSLLLTYRKQIQVIGFQQKKIVDLERELKQTVEELKQLKDVDVRLSRKKALK